MRSESYVGERSYMKTMRCEEYTFFKCPANKLCPIPM